MSLAPSARWPSRNCVAWLASHGLQQLEAGQPCPVGRRRRQIAAVTQAEAVPTGQLTRPKIQRLKIPLMRARALQEGAYSVIYALNRHDVSYPYPTTQMNRQAAFRQHSDSTLSAVNQNYRRRARCTYSTPNFGEVHLEGAFDHRNLPIAASSSDGPGGGRYGYMPDHSRP